MASITAHASDGHGAHNDKHGHGHTAHGDPNSPFHIHHPPLITYFVIYGVLLFLLAVTVGLYYVDLNRATGWSWPNIIVALIVAIIKATLVVLFFMNVRGSTRLTWLWAALGFIWLLLMGGIFMDYQSRAWIDSTGWQ
jgi:cytochrome c oxidase subunit 4